jgi:hypothetical protein
MTFLPTRVTKALLCHERFGDLRMRCLPGKPDSFHHRIIEWYLQKHLDFFTPFWFSCKSSHLRHLMSRFHGRHCWDGIKIGKRAHLIPNCCLCTLPARLVDHTTYSLGFVEGATVGMIRVGFTLVGGALITLTVRTSRYAYLESLIDQSLESETEMRLHHSFTKLGVRGQNKWFINFSTYLPENNIHCSLSFRWRFHLFLMSFFFRPLPNSDAILA